MEANTHINEAFDLLSVGGWTPQARDAFEALTNLERVTLEQLMTNQMTLFS